MFSIGIPTVLVDYETHLPISSSGHTPLSLSSSFSTSQPYLMSYSLSIPYSLNHILLQNGFFSSQPISLNSSFQVFNHDGIKLFVQLPSLS